MKRSTSQTNSWSTALLLVCIGLSGNALALGSGNLYSWTGADGTPTYSPDPPPAGTVYTVVGPDLKPLPRYQNAARATPSKPQTAAKSESDKLKPLVMTSPPAKAAAMGPQQPAAARPAKAQRKAASKPDNHVSCMKMRKRIGLLENQFASATTNAEMDQAIVALQQQTERFSRECN